MDRVRNERILRCLKKGILIESVLIIVFAAIVLGKRGELLAENSSSANVLSIENDYIKWVDFTVSYEALCKAYDWDVKTHGSEHEIDWVELLAYTAAKTGGAFGKDALKTMEKAAEKLSAGEVTMEELTKELKYYAYYKEAYDAAIGGLVGEYWEEDPEAPQGNPAEGTAERTGYIKKYGLKGYFPLARGFDYNHYDDFGAGRSYGYKRKHLGHDMMGLVGTPIMAVESGVVTALGWNQYGGWRIGISSFDGKRYYYYAHLRQNYPYAEGLEEGSVVTAGDVIGYMGHTGYSAKENVNNIEVVHLHWGLQLIFDESQKKGNNEIWIDLYPLTRFLAKHTQAAVKVEGTKEWRRTTDIVDPAVEEYEAGHKAQKEDDENRVPEQTQ
ncbi:M23 family metallopeptidase [Acetatifactor muris]|uniref:L-Ala--D-Glu endopeptidase n=1 Tax=Acetatifactor muris TaxID=879566 RepID=A0A2K4ZD40_9FIRM|nr:M23 family metallopeptidase [Acetatifactor muris]MCR2046788.1 M23 family metallopeptidase [Acetatifactor muris]SOY28382.1 L-Ala--D-Glu endopeptidase precursor [Acetatifactor muris]